MSGKDRLSYGPYLYALSPDVLAVLTMHGKSATYNACCAAMILIIWGVLSVCFVLVKSIADLDDVAVSVGHATKLCALLLKRRAACRCSGVHDVR